MNRLVALLVATLLTGQAIAAGPAETGPAQRHSVAQVAQAASASGAKQRQGGAGPDEKEEAAESAGSVREAGSAIVIAADAKLAVDGKDTRALPPGTLVTYSLANGPWLWVDKEWAWINRADVVPIRKAERHFTNIISEAEENGPADVLPVALHHRGIARLARGEQDLALADFERALLYSEANAALYLNKAQALRGLDKLDDAVAAATEAIKLAPESSPAHAERARILAEQEQFDASLRDSDRAIELDPENAEALNNRGVTRRLLGKFRPALDDYNAALKVAPRYHEALANRGYALKRLGKLSEAVVDYKRSLKIAPDRAVVHNDLAWLLATAAADDVRDPQTALVYARKAVELTNEEDGRFLDTLAAAHAAAGDFDKAAEVARKAVAKLDEAEQFEADQRLTLYLKQKPYIER